VPPAPLITTESVPEAGCMSEVKSSVLSERYLEQHRKIHLKLNILIYVTVKYSFQN
jgi:hypothetical protein